MEGALSFGGSPEVMSEEEVRAAVRLANIPTLLMVVFQVTGDRKWLKAPFKPTRGKGLTDHDSGGLPEDVQDQIREAGVSAVLQLLSGKPPAIALPDPDLTVEMMRVCIAEKIPTRYGPMFASELAKRTAGRPAPESVAAKPAAGFNMIIIGAGVAGIVAARELGDIGVDFTILEKQPAPGGVWWQNTYPGAGVDTPSHLYSFSFAKRDWEMHFELRRELQRYLDQTIDEVAGPERIRYDTEVLSAEFDTERSEWVLQVRNGEGEEEELRANILLSAVGSLNQPRVPEIKDAHKFLGQTFHSAAWPEGVSVAGKRVVVVGTGASAMQIVPAVSGEVEHLTVVQRSPTWVAPFDKLMKPIPPEVRDLLQAVPLYQAWYWLRLFWQFGDKVVEALRIDPAWPHPERSVNKRNDGHRKYFTRYLNEKLAGRPDLIEKSLPTYPPFGKRILLDNGWFEALKRPNVSLSTGTVVALTESQVVLDSGERIDADVIVWATGFDSSRFISSLEVVGTDGRTLRQVWDDDDPRAYMGVSVPGFPNLLILGGPNAFPGSGSFMFSMEMQMGYICRLLLGMFDQGFKTLEATTEANEQYNQRVDELHSETVWTHPGMSTYYRNSRGRVVYVMPFLTIEYWEMAQRTDFENYVLETESKGRVAAG